MDALLLRYKDFLKLSAERYVQATRKHHIRCKPGCHECCTTGFFDITLLDALYLREALQRIPARIRRQIIAKANDQLDRLEEKKVFSRKEPLLRSVPAIKALARATQEMSCPALGKSGKCIIYKDRPHICRVFGPTIRGYRRKVWLRGCRYFKKDVREEDVGMADQYVEETMMKQELFQNAGRRKIRDIDTIIPAAITLDLREWL